MMKVLGLIMEANPFHTGHEYYIKKAIELVKPNYVVCLMSGNYTMRGEVSIINKWDKAKIAIELGCDLVLDFPTYLTVNSRDEFSQNAVKILDKFGITHIACGVETNDLQLLKKFAVMEMSEKFQAEIKNYLDEGLNYKTSAKRVMMKHFPDSISEYSLPNNTLAIGYLKGIKKAERKISPVLIERIFSSHFATSLTDVHSSSSAIRRNISRGNIPSDYLLDLNINYLKEDNLNTELYSIFQYAVSQSSLEDLKKIKGINDGLENRIKKMISSKNYDEFLETCETKRYPKNYLKRVIINTVGKVYKDNGYTTDYLRILKMNAKGISYLNSLNEETKKLIFYSMKEKKTREVEHELEMTKLYGIITKNPKIYEKEFNIGEVNERK